MSTQGLELPDMTMAMDGMWIDTDTGEPISKKVLLEVETLENRGSDWIEFICDDCDVKFQAPYYTIYYNCAVCGYRGEQ